METQKHTPFTFPHPPCIIEATKESIAKCYGNGNIAKEVYRMDNKAMNRKKSVFDPDRTKELQKDWQGYGKANVYYGLVVLFIFAASFFYHFFIK